MVYVDDTAILVMNEEISQPMLHELVKAEKNYGVEINID